MKKSLVKVMAVSSAALLLGGTYTLVINAEETNTPTEETTNPTEENPGSADSTPSEEPTETIPETTEEETTEEVEEFATPAEPADSAEPTPSEEPAETAPETVDEGTPEERIGNILVFRRDLDGKIHHLSDELNAETEISVTHADEELHVTQNNNWFTVPHKTDSNQGNEYEYAVKLPSGYRVVTDDVISPLGSRVVMDDITLTAGYPTYARQLRSDVGEFLLFNGKHTFFIAIEEATVETTEEETLEAPKEPATPEERIGNILVFRRDLDGKTHYLSDELNANTEISVSHDDEELHVTQNNNQFTIHHKTDSNQGNEYGYAVTLPVGYRVVTENVTLTVPFPNRNYAGQLKSGVGEFSLRSGWQTFSIVIEDATEDDDIPEVSDTRRLQYIKQYVGDRFTDASEEEIDAYVIDLIKQLEESKRTPADSEDSSYDDLTKPGNDIIDVVVEEGPEPSERTPGSDDLTSLKDDVIDVNDETRTGKVVVYVRDLNGRIHRANNDLIAETGILVSQETPDKQTLELEVENEIANWFSFTDNTDSQHGHDYGYEIGTPEGYRVASDDITLPPSLATYAKQLKAGVGELELVDGTQAYFIVLDYGKDEDGSAPGETVPSHDDLTKPGGDITDVVVDEGSEPGEIVPGYDDLTEPGNDITDVVVEEGPEPGVTTPSHDDLTEPSDDITDVVVVVEEGSEPGETVPGHDDNTKLADDIIDIFTQEGPKPGETVPGADEETTANPENKVGRTDTLVLDETRTGKVVVYVRDINGRIHRANNDLIAEIEIHVSQETPDRQTLELDVVNEVDNWFSFTDNTDSQHGHDYGYEIGTPEGYRVASDDITLPPSLATYAKQLKAGVGQFPLDDGTQTYFIVLDHGKDEEGPKPGETVPGADEATRTNPENKVGRTDTLVLDETRTGKVVVYVRDINGRIHRANNDLIAELDIHVSQETPDRQTIELDVVNEVDNWFSFTDKTDSQYSRDYRYEIETPEGYRVASDNITLTDPYATYAKQLKAGVGELQLADGVQSYFIVLNHGKDEEGPKPGETTPSYDDLTKLGKDITDVVVDEGSRPGETTSGYDDLTKPGTDITDVVVEEGPKPGGKTPSHDDKTKLSDKIIEVLVSSVDDEDTSSDDLTKPGDDLTDVVLVVEDGPEPGEKASSHDDKTKPADDIIDVITEEGPEPGETTPSHDDTTKLADDVIDVITEEGPAPGETTPSYDDKTKLADDVIDVITEEGPKPGETVPSHDDKTKLADDVIDVVIDEESKTDEETAKTSEDSTEKSTDEKLPETGEVSSTAIFSAAALSILAGLGLVAPVSKKED